MKNLVLPRCTLALVVGFAYPILAQQAQSLHPVADPTHHLSTKEFFKDLGSNFAAIIDVKSIAPLAVGAAATGLSTIPEQDLERHFARGNVWGAWADPGKYVGNPLILGGVATAMFAGSRKSESTKFRSLSYSLVQGVIMDAAIVQSTKAGFQRLRPSGEDHYAFPSGHATDSFMFATVFAEHYGWKAAIPGYVVAAYVSATRLEERKHHLTDVVVGASIGYLVGKTVSRRILHGEKSRFGWSVSPLPKGIVGMLRINM